MVRMIEKSATRQISGYEGGQDIRERAFEFACQVAMLCQKLYESGGVARLFVSQLLACSSSTATMLEEGRAAESDVGLHLQMLNFAQGVPRSLDAPSDLCEVRSRATAGREKARSGKQRTHRHHPYDHQQQEGEDEDDTAWQAPRGQSPS
jgi:hypothetical protein